ncbi:hypothetical protein [Streptomyces hydrogenans]|uniref:hypothetical protein n=1 Tax=Streptomyces hydrogenans TaxID=1873719 RepID=UPI0035D5BCE6
MTIMPSDLPLNPTGIAETVQDTVNEVFPLFAEIQMLARTGIRVSVEVAPSSIIATITVEKDAAYVLPALLAEIDDARPGTPLPNGQMVVTGSMCQGAVTLRVVIPEGWVSADELAVLTGTASFDTTDLR